MTGRRIISAFFLAASFILSSCVNFKHVKPYDIEKSERLVSRKSRSKKINFEYFVHYNNQIYPIQQPELVKLRGGDFITANSKVLSDSSYITTYDWMNSVDRPVQQQLEQYINQVHFTLKDSERPLFDEKSIINSFEILDIDIYHKIIPRGVIAGNSLGGIVIIGSFGFYWAYQKFGHPFDWHN